VRRPSPWLAGFFEPLVGSLSMSELCLATSTIGCIIETDGQPDSNLAYVHIHGVYRVNQAEYVIHILVVAPQEYVNIYSTRKPITWSGAAPAVVITRRS